ncbi:MAG: radical SAM protein [Promethearchaeota archaeon]
MTVKTKGTKEWADTNVNCYYGCSNNCRYCYARHYALRFKRIEKYEDWEKMKPNYKSIEKNYRKRKGRIMFPTSHDITSESFYNCTLVLRKLLKAGNNVLITTKPYLFAISNICNKFEEFKKQIQFRFTITSISDRILFFLEPKAPFFFERIASLKYAFNKGFKTSVSIEPYLDKDLNPLIKEIAPYCSESIWIGKMSNLNKVIARLIWEIQQIPHDPLQPTSEINKIRFFIKYIYEINQLKHISKIIDKIKTLPENIKEKIRLKDSIRNLGYTIK